MEGMNMNKKILLLDKDNDILGLAHELMFYGYSDMHITSDPEALYKIAEYYRPDLIILDMALIANDVDTISKALKSNIELKNIPIIAVSKSYNRIINEASGADTVFIKPFDNQDFAHKVGYLMAS